MHKLFVILFCVISLSSYAQYCHTDFESQPAGTAYVRSMWQADGFTTATWDQGLATRTMIDNSTSVSGTKSLRITYPAQTFGPDINGAQVPLLVEPADELYMSYWIRFSENFTWGTTNFGGKIPGIAGGNDCSGGEYCDGTNGFSCRYMWRAGGRACLYLYDMTKENFYGEDHDLLYPDGSNVTYVPGQWMHIAERVKINSDASKSDGEIETWVNGVQVLHLTGRKFVTNGDKADKLYISTFHGGDDDTWCPLETCYIWLDDIKISTNKSDVEYQYCSSPKLGIDRTLCGETSIELNSQIKNELTVCTWQYNGTVVGVGKTYQAKQAGTYIVTADSLGCIRKDTIVLYSDVQPNLGNDRHICDNSYETLDANVVGSSVSYRWYKDNVLLSNEKSRTIRVKESGTYVVKVSANSCSEASDEVVVTSGLIEISDIEAEANQSVTLTIENPETTIYDWYDAEKNGTLLNSGNSFAVNSGATTKTYFVEDKSGLTALVGKPRIISDYSWTYATSDEDESKERRMKFEVFKTLSIDSVTMTLCGAQDIVINIYGEDNSTLVYTTTVKNLPAGDQRMAVGATLEPGVYYMGTKGSTGRIRYTNDSDTDVHFPYTIDDVISLLGSNIGWIGTKYYLFFYNMRISTGNFCARTPVSVIVNSPSDLQVQTVQLKKGWNLVSINVHPTDSTIETLFAGLSVDLVKDETSFWKSEHASELQSLTSLTAGCGYLVYMNDTGTLSVLGKPMKPYVASKGNGWSLIGCPYQTDTPIESIYDANNCQMLKNLNGVWQPEKSGNTLENIQPGQGYFLK